MVLSWLIFCRSLRKLWVRVTWLSIWMKSIWILIMSREERIFFFSVWMARSTWSLVQVNSYFIFNLFLFYFLVVLWKMISIFLRISLRYLFYKFIFICPWFILISFRFIFSSFFTIYFTMERIMLIKLDSFRFIFRLPIHRILMTIT